MHDALVNHCARCSLVMMVVPSMQSISGMATTTAHIHRICLPSRPTCLVCHAGHVRGLDEVARQAGVCYYSPDLLEDKATQLKMGGYDTLSDTDKKEVIDSIEQEYSAYLFLNNSNTKIHSQ